MADINSVADILYRFMDERDHIERYVEFLRTKSTIHDRQVEDLNCILRRVQVPLVPVRQYDRIGEPFSPQEIADLLSGTRRAEPEIYQTILGHEQGMDGLPWIDFDSPVGDCLDLLNEWIDYFVPLLSDDPENDDEEAMLKYALHHAQQTEEENDEEDRISLDSLKQIVSLALEHARQVWFRQRVDAMVYARQQFEEIEILVRVATSGSEINVLRQGFILLMTAFDAAVFGLVRAALFKNFFGLIGEFGKQDKISYERIGATGSFASLREQVIDEQLRGKYVRDLLFLLKSLGVECAVETENVRFVHLIELVLRRNLHVHGRGYVDERYLERGHDGKPKYNVYNFALGEYATIDLQYWESAVRLSDACIRSVAKWAEMLPKSD